MAVTIRDRILDLRTALDARILGQERLTESLLVALLARGHLLVEGVPGIGKTSAVKALATGLEGSFQRIQFTPDLLPADITGSDVFDPDSKGFAFRHGPLFNNFILADEINRAPAKVQSALLEAMGEEQVTVGRRTFELPQPFMVMATQNPIEQDGTYPLPESQRDRFLLHVRVGYPSKEREQDIFRLVRDTRRQGTELARLDMAPIDHPTLEAAHKECLGLDMVPEIEDYLVRLVDGTRDPGPLDDGLTAWIRFGASPRATIALDMASRAIAWMDGRDYVTPDDVLRVAPDVLRHRVILTYRAEAEGVTEDMAIERLLRLVAVP